MLPQESEKLSIVIVGHVDHGKSTVIGRLLADTGALPQGKLEQIRAYCAAHSMPFEYAFLIDALKDERRQNITIDSARVFFQSSRRRYIIIDAPGHVEFVKNMVTGAARAEAALLVIDAQEGIQENSRRHGKLLSMLGIAQVAVLVNKMDLVDFEARRFEDIRAEYTRFLAQIGLKPAGFIPVSARMGENISQASSTMPWYNGPTVLEMLDSFEKEAPLTDRPFRLPVQDVYRFSAFGDDRRIVAGTVSSGRARAGDRIIFYPSGKQTPLATVEAFGTPPQSEIQAGQAAGFTLGQQIYVKRGEVAALAGEPPPRVARRLRVSLFWLGNDPLRAKKSYLLKLGTARTRCQVEQIRRVMDASSLDEAGEASQVERYAMAECVLTLDHPIAFDRADFLPATSRFVLVDGYEIRGGGIILEDLPDADADVRQAVWQRSAHWILSDVTQEERAERYNQRSCAVVITGKKGSGRKQLGRALEALLFREGKFVYYLGLGSVKYGLDADLGDHSDEKSRREHIRRLAEAAHLFLDAGCILVITAVELSQADRKLLETVVDADKLKVIWLGGDPTTDIVPDHIFPADHAVDQASLWIKRLLQDQGFLYRP